MEDDRAPLGKLTGAAASAALQRWLEEARPGGAHEPPAVVVLGRDPLHDLVGELWRAALEEALDRAAMERLLWTAVRHGELRRRQGCTEYALLDEYRLLRRLLRPQLSAGVPAVDSANAAAERLQAGITLCVGGAIRGFHRDELAAAGDWPHVVLSFLHAFRPPGEPRRDLTA